MSNDVEELVVRDMVNLAELIMRVRKYRYVIFNALIWILFGTTYAALYLIFIGVEIYLAQFELYSTLTSLSCIYPIIPFVVSIIVLRRVAKKIRNDNVCRKDDRVHLLVFAAYFIIIYALLIIIFNILNMQETSLSALVGGYVLSTVWYPILGLCFLTIYLIARRHSDVRVERPFYPDDFRVAGIAVLVTTPLLYVPLIKIVVGHVRVSTSMVLYIPIAGGAIATGLMLAVYIGVAVLILVSAVRVLYVRKEQEA